jgi:hypothetical protein
VETKTAKPNLQKWGKGSVRVYRTINGPNQEPRIELNLQANPEHFEEAIEVITSIIVIFSMFFIVGLVAFLVIYFQ